jgi:hypothetical protein
MSLSSLDWRSRVARLYADIRSADNVRSAHECPLAPPGNLVGVAIGAGEGMVAGSTA